MNWSGGISMATEKRLIDANKIPWEEWYVPDPESKEQWDFKAELGVSKPAIDKMPTVYAVEVVRCNNCGYWMKDDPSDNVGYCINPDGLDNYAKPDDFCSYGERRTDGR